jgi:hypothetical protein
MSLRTLGHLPALSAEACTVRELLRKTNAPLRAHPERGEVTPDSTHAREAIGQMVPWLIDFDSPAWGAWAAKQFDQAIPFLDGHTPNVLRDVVLQPSPEPGMFHILEGKQHICIAQTCALWGLVRSARAEDGLSLAEDLLQLVFLNSSNDRCAGGIRVVDWNLFNELAEPLRKSRRELLARDGVLRVHQASFDEFDQLFQELQPRVTNPHASFITKVIDELDGAAEVLRNITPNLSEAAAVHAVMRCVLDFNLLTVKVLGRSIDGLAYVSGKKSHPWVASSRSRRRA